MPVTESTGQIFQTLNLGPNTLHLSFLSPVGLYSPLKSETLEHALLFHSHVFQQFLSLLLTLFLTVSHLITWLLCTSLQEIPALCPRCNLPSSSDKHTVSSLHKAYLYLCPSHSLFSATDRVWLAAGHCSMAKMSSFNPNSHRSRHLPV